MAFSKTAAVRLMLVTALAAGAMLYTTQSTEGPDLANSPAVPSTACDSRFHPLNTHLCVNQSEGVSDTAFAVQGAGFAPLTPVTVTLSEISPPPDNKPLFQVTSPDMQVTGPHGSFQIPVHKIHPGP
jgi:hypothetical protein